MRSTSRVRTWQRRAGVAAAIAVAAGATAGALASRFAIRYRDVAGRPASYPSMLTPSDVGLVAEEVLLATDGPGIHAWFVPAPEPGRRPAVVLLHGWESNRGRMLPYAQLAHAIGLHALVVEARGHGVNEPETLPLTVLEFAHDAEAALAYLEPRGEIGRIGLVGHSLGGVGSILAASTHGDSVQALVSIAAPADPRLLIRETFRIAGLQIPDLVAHPLAWWTARLYVRPRGYTLGEVSARRAIARYGGPVLLIHGEADAVAPVRDVRLLDAAARSGRTAGAAAEVRTLVLPGVGHSWQYEHPGVRRALAAFLTETLGGPLSPTEAADLAEGLDLSRPPDNRPARFSALRELGPPTTQD